MTPAPPAGLAGLCLVLLAVHVLLRALLALRFPLVFDEAYFWEWSRFPSTGYFDHPPMVAWVIGVAALVFGERSPIAVRAGALLFGGGVLLLIYRLALQLFNDRTVALRSLLVALSLPLLSAVGVIMLPDGPLVFFHLLALSLFASALRGARAGAWWLTGLALGLALLSKLVAVLTLVGLGVFLVTSPYRFWLKRKDPYLALGLAILVFSPFLLWDSAHEWASLRLHLWDRPRLTLGPSLWRTGEFLFEQVANASVFLVVPLLGCLWVRAASLPEAWRLPYRLLRCQSLTVLIYFLVVGSISETHPHWSVLAYPTAAIALAVLWSSRPRHVFSRGLGWWTAMAQGTLILAACVALVGLPWLARVTPDQSGGPLATGLVKGRVRLFGWADLSRQLDPFLKEAGGEAVLFAHGHQRASMLSFQREGAPVINLAAYWRRGTKVGDAQWYYIPVESLDGKSGIFVTDTAWITSEHLRRSFEKADEVATIEQRHADRLLERHRVFRVVRFRADAIRRGDAYRDG